MARYALDIEATGLLDHTSIDYSVVPYKLKKSYKIWCAVFVDIDTRERIRLRPDEVDQIPKIIEDRADMLVLHNGVSYDLLALKLYFGLDYEINEYDYTKCKVGGKEVAIIDTMILSQYLKPDRIGGHSLHAWGKRLGNLKGDYGEEENAWDQFTEDMLDYNEQDSDVTADVFFALMEEWGDWDHAAAFSMEQAINEIVVRQEHVGFYFNMEKAKVALDDLNNKLREIERNVEPQLPKSKLAKTNAAKYKLPARQINQDGSISASLTKWADKHGGALSQDEYGEWQLEVFGKTISLPGDNKEPLVTHAPMKVSDQKQMKQYLVSLGWNPIEWEFRDITLKSGTKQKVNFDKYKEAVLRYCEETAKSHFKGHRLTFSEVDTVKELYQKLMSADITRPVKVRTSPKYTIDQEKTICPNLMKMGAEVSWIKDVVLWLTYRHRRNMLQSPNGSGLMLHERIKVDGRVPTGAIVTGTNTYRFKHRVCVNIPRPSSVYGSEIRELFGCGGDFYQIGCDAASLEGRVQGHYCFPYTDGESLAATLIAEKPNDIHSVRARSLGISRDDAKSIGYACVPTYNTEVLTEDGWKFYEDLRVGDMVMSYNSEKHISEFKPITHVHYYDSAEVVTMKHSNGFEVESTKDHRWFTKRRTGRGKTKRYVDEVCTTQDLTSEHSIVTSAPINAVGCYISKDEAELVGWLASDGYFRWSEDTRRTSSSNGLKRGVVAGITQDKSKFLTNITELLERLCLDYYTYQYEDKACEVRLSQESARTLLDKVFPTRQNKHEIDWVKFVLSLDRDCLEKFAYAFYLAEGVTNSVDNFYERKTKVLSQNEGGLLDALQITGQLLGWRTIVSNGYKGGTNSCKDIKWTSKGHVTMQRVHREVTKEVPVFCLTVEDNDSFIIRQGNTVTITGNCLYGAQWPKLQSMLGCTASAAKTLHTEFWESTPALLDLKKRVEKYWYKHGKKYLKGIDGRKILTRSKHSLLNALFQSAGIILMKWAAIWLDREMDKRGILFKPFDSTTWDGKAAQMQHYHDEYQHKVHPSLVEKDSEGNLHSIVGDLMEQAIAEAGKILNMRVAFAGEAMIGTNWRDCH